MTPVLDAVNAATVARCVSDALRARSEASGNRKAWILRTADDLDTDKRTIEKWEYGETCPTGWNLLQLFVYFGQDFANDVLGMVGLVAAAEGDVSAVPDALAAKQARRAFQKMEKDLDCMRAALFPEREEEDAA